MAGKLGIFRRKKSLKESQGTEVVLPDSKTKKDKAKQPQTSKERNDNATGKISAITTRAGPKPLSMSAYRSMGVDKMDASLEEARKAYKAGEITKSDLGLIIKRVKEAKLRIDGQLAKNKRLMDQGKSDKKSKVKPLDNSMSVKEKDMPRKVIKIYKGGMAKKKKPSYNKGGYVNCGASNPGTQKRN